MHDAEHEDHAVPVDHVVHDAVVPDTEPMERVPGSLDRLDGLAADALGLRRARGELLQGLADPPLEVGCQLLEGPDGGGGQLDAVGVQGSSSRLVVRPFE